MGVVIKFEQGQLIGAMCKKIPFPFGALEVEARPAEEGIIFARDLGLREVIVEEDASSACAFTCNSNTVKWQVIFWNYGHYTENHTNIIFRRQFLKPTRSFHF